MIFVFGSNLSGRHGKGSALTARKYYGAIYGRGVGPQGNSYAIPTKDYDMHTLPLRHIEDFVKEFLQYAKNNPDLIFNVTEIGCGLAGYTPEQIAPMFKRASVNCKLPKSFKVILQSI